MGAALALSSPLTVVFWAAVQGMVHEDLGRSATTTELALVAAAYLLAAVVYFVMCYALSYCVKQLHKKIAIIR